MNKFDLLETEGKLQITINSKVSTWVKMVLGLLTLFSLIGLIGLFSRLPTADPDDLMNSGIGVTIFIIIILFFGRLFLWNSFGKEVLKMEKGKFKYQYDYKFFKSEEEEIGFSRVVAMPFSEQHQTKDNSSVIDEELLKDDSGACRLRLVFDEEEYLSQIELEKEDLISILQVISTFLKKIEKAKDSH